MIGADPSESAPQRAVGRPDEILPVVGHVVGASIWGSAGEVGVVGLEEEGGGGGR